MLYWSQRTSYIGQAESFQVRSKAGRWKQQTGKRRAVATFREVQVSRSSELTAWGQEVLMRSWGCNPQSLGQKQQQWTSGARVWEEKADLGTNAWFPEHPSCDGLEWIMKDGLWRLQKRKWIWNQHEFSKTREDKLASLPLLASVLG